MKICLIAACDKNLGIGYQGQLPWHLPADFAFFKAQTLGKALVMGRKTFESIGRPLPGRRNIILSSQNYHHDGIEVIHAIDDVLSSQLEELMVIGGQQVYQLFLPFASQIILTEVDAECQVDAYFPRFSLQKFKCVSEKAHPADEKNAYAMTFKVYSKIC
jgi:dihydrofolate reductase